jgi:hypothetical protein
MRKECNPSKKRGDRNVFCSEYNNCLDIAITKSWNTWNCNKCPFRFSQAIGKQNLAFTTETIVEYGLMLQPMNFDWGILDVEFSGEFDSMTLGSGY